MFPHAPFLPRQCTAPHTRHVEDGRGRGVEAQLHWCVGASEAIEQRRILEGTCATDGIHVCGGGVYTFEQARGANYIMRKASKALKLKHTITQVQCGRRVRDNCAEADVWSQDGDSFEVIMTANVPFFPKQVFKGTVGGPTIEQKDWLVSCVLAECIAGPPLTPVCASLGRPKRC